MCMYDGQPRGSQDRGESRMTSTSVSVLCVPLLLFLASENKLSWKRMQEENLDTSVRKLNMSFNISFCGRGEN